MLPSDNDLSLRSICAKDMTTLFKWRNLDEIVSLGSSSRKVTLSEHQAWFNQRLHDPLFLGYIVEVDNHPIGHVRFDFDSPESASISLYLVPGQTGKGRGVFLIKRSCFLAKAAKPSLLTVTACIVSTNIRSIKSFENAGFQLFSCFPSPSLQSQNLQSYILVLP